MKIIISSNSHKELATSETVNSWIIDGLKNKIPSAQVLNIPISDGGDGLVDFFIKHADEEVEIVSAQVHDPLWRKIEAKYCIIQKNVAIIEFSEASGIKRLSANERFIRKTTSFGVGELILHAIKKGCLDIIIGLGGAATSDAGIGACKALGLEILDKYRHSINRKSFKNFGSDLLDKVAQFEIEKFQNTLRDVRLTFLCDVNNPLLGKNGSARVFGPQKGASSHDVESIERGMGSIRDLLKIQTKRDVNVKYMGAAGGFPVIFSAFLDVEAISGIEFLLNYINFKKIIHKADLVITGEGKLDELSMFGKAPIGIAQVCQEMSVPVSGIFGTINPGINKYESFFKEIVNASKNFHVDIYNLNHRNVLIPKLMKESVAKLNF